MRLKNGVMLGMLSLCAACTAANLPAAEVNWVGGGSDSRFTTNQNWEGSPSAFKKNNYGLTTNQSAGNTYNVAKGQEAVITGFDLNTATININGNITSYREKYNSHSFNGYWMRGNVTLTFGEDSSVQYLNGSAVDTIQLTMAGSGNILNLHNDSTHPFKSMFISTYDGNGGNNNHLNQYAGTITAEDYLIGTQSDFADADISSYNLYGGTCSTQNLYLNLHNNKYGRGEINIHGGSLSVSNALIGGTSVDSGTSYKSDINLHIGSSEAGFGTFAMTGGTNSYTGNFSVTMDAPIVLADLTLASKPIISLNTLSGNEVFNIETGLFKRSDDGKTVTLNTAKNLKPNGISSIAETLKTDGASEGYVVLPENATMVEFTTNTFASQEAADAFANWMTTTGLTAQALNPSTFMVESLSEMSDIFMFDFTNYSAGSVQLNSFTAHNANSLPEPSSVILLLAGTFGIGFLARRRKMNLA